MRKVFWSSPTACGNFVTCENEEHKSSTFKIKRYTKITATIVHWHLCLESLVLTVINGKNTVIPQQEILFTIGY